MPENICFPEPEVPDPTPGRWGERIGAWLQRSSSDRATACRRFYNSNLDALPPETAATLCARLHRDRSQATHFELVVGRFLQLVGAVELQHEVPGSENRKVDWVARFPDGLVSVEATAPTVNATVGAKLAAAQPIAELILELAPRGWHPVVLSAPRLARSEPRQWLRRWLREELEALPPHREGETLQLELRLENGPLKVDFVAASDPDMESSGVSGPAVGYIDNTSEVVHRAVAGKRPQARGAVKPVLAALYTGGFGHSELEKFDIALFGRTVHHLATGEQTFDTSGIFGQGAGEPTFAGALVFANLGWGGGPDPVLYKHPRHGGRLPGALMELRRRELGPAGIVGMPPSRTGVLAQLGCLRLDDHEAAWDELHAALPPSGR